MELHVVINGRKDLAGQLYQQLRSAIESGRLAAGTQLPPSRLLAEQLGISRKTISDTYAQLTYENFLTGRIGKGTYVNPRPSAIVRKQSHCELASADILERWRNMPWFLRHPTQEGSLRYEFIGGATSKGLFPQDDWRRCTAHALRQIAGSKGFYSEPEGLPTLRNAIARHIAFSRGVNCQDDDVVVCNGAQQALDLISRVLTEPGSLVAMEDPGYPPARLLFTSHGAEAVGVPVDEQGIQVELIPDGTRLIYVTPSHQFPLGMPMSQARREALLARAHELGAIIIEDDYDSEFRYAGRPTDSLQSMDERGIVAYVGTFSKTLLPELRLGYAILPPAILDAVIRAKQLTDLHTSTLPQWALAKFIAEGCLLKHIRRCHTVYAGRRERILARVAGDLSPWLEAVPTTAGFHMALLCKVEVDVPLVITLAKKLDVGLYGLSGFYYQQPPRAGLFMGFGSIETLDIDSALDRLRDILQQVC
ncbi:PLP-dependent aminotransferase family protein [Pseudomonas sp. FW306-02-F02-AA]|uniref:DNA-binding protein n=1 Tax=Pseudomonas fluorescens TaxID=294 RepID=A0A0N9WGI2_PSEFL|nr:MULTISPECIES: PLP-dependent aminotransferase family protein [Pseudomonas]ALI03768.1 DNA-binding protein [Pseudomonas fluorescens]PMZ03061.1 PLP-dependent aminotransferase family protein [Pseudomonas sp. FW306-02-F02-AB]PMZ11853.1 PLP-dependent aminotransferase family protein [Pseudomonas sp. FW306-02-H06C]PMZ14471.1 PLP-dependent aminotransferase family protein [Pseudomonas sp. FW306-02-F02-AA]PMZ20512.1 PLP-dependent aminotransferase family protein [Pseudomonas sp. FW306-02-F08-AA]